MSLFDPREPVSAWSHAAGMCAGLPVAWLLVRRGLEAMRSQSQSPSPSVSSSTSSVEIDDERRRYHAGKLVCLAVFGGCLIFCYGASMLYHAARLDADAVGRLRRLDHVGIFLMIAGTFTPAAWSLMRPSWGRVGLWLAWGAALGCGARVGLVGPFTPWLATAVYLSLGWAMIIAYYDIQRVRGHRALIGLPLGGAFYSVGAVVNLAHWPILAPGAVGAHELFHLFVLAGTAAHVQFMFQVVAPAQPTPRTAAPADGRAPAPPPHWRRTAARTGRSVRRAG